MTIDDNTPMMWGKWKDVKMCNVPGTYLIWLGDTIEAKHVTKRNLTEKELLKYIESNRALIMKESKKV